MIPLVIIGKIITAILTGVVFYYIQKSWKESKDNPALNYFMKFCLFSFLTFSAFILFIFIKNLYAIQAIFYIVQILTFTAISYALLMVLTFINFKKFNKLIFSLFVLSGIIITLVPGNLYRQAIVYNYNFAGLEFTGFIPNFPPETILAITLLVLISILFCWLVVLIQGISIPDSYTRKKAIIFSTGILFMGIGAITYFSPGILIPTSFWRDVVHIIGLILGITFLHLAHVYKEKNPAAD